MYHHRKRETIVIFDTLFFLMWNKLSSNCFLFVCSKVSWIVQFPELVLESTCVLSSIVHYMYREGQGMYRSVTSFLLSRRSNRPIQFPSNILLEQGHLTWHPPSLAQGMGQVGKRAIFSYFSRSKRSIFACCFTNLRTWASWEIGDHEYWSVSTNSKARMIRT